MSSPVFAIKRVGGTVPSENGIVIHCLRVDLKQKVTTREKCFNVKNETLQSLMGFYFKIYLRFPSERFRTIKRERGEKNKMWIRELIELAVFFFFFFSPASNANSHSHCLRFAFNANSFCSKVLNSSFG